MRKAVVICVLVLAASFHLQAKKNKKPNVIVIFTDDHRYTGVHALGGQAVMTPNLDELAHSGIAFTKTYLMGAMTGATCVPSRAMLHTGRDMFSLDGNGANIPEGHTTMGEVFQKAGFHAHYVGKWHNDNKSLARSFNTGGRLVGKPKYLTDQFRMPYSDWRDDGDYKEENCYLLEYNEQGEVYRRPLTKDDKRGPTGTEKTGPHVSEVLADDAVEFIRGYEGKQPYFMYLAFPTPHDPRQAPQEYYDMYPVDEIQLPPSYMPQHPFDNGMIVIRDEKLAEWPRTPEIARKHLSEYYAIITHLDAQIGRVIKALKASGEYGNTIILFAGDSGLAVGNHGLMGKQNTYDEDGLHVPFIISGGIINEDDRGRREDALCYIHDILPTICDLVDVPAPASANGISLMPVIDGETDRIRDYTYHAFRHHQRAYRKGDYKLIEFVRAPDAYYSKPKPSVVDGSHVTLLFNITEDPWETFNLADFNEYKDILAGMRAEMKKKAVELGDKPDGDRTKYDFWDYYRVK